MSSIRRALLSVWDKTGVVELGRGLAERGVELITSGGTARTLEEAGLAVTSVDQLTQAPEFLGGRVKTLHPAVHGAILARRDSEADMADLAARGIAPIDLVVVNLYPFGDAEMLGATEEAARTELIDIGGVTLIRAAAKNWRHVTVVTEPSDYEDLIVQTAVEGKIGVTTRRRLAAKAMRLTAWYDSQIAVWMSEDEDGWPERWTIGGELVAELRYGENPHQAAAIYRDRPPRPADLAAVEILQGKALSYNNYIDAEAARRVIRDLYALDPARAHCTIIKHTIPCGVASADTPLEAYTRALAADPVSAFGGIVALTSPVDGPLASKLAEHFLEVVYAPSFEPKACEVLARKKNLRLLAGPVPDFDETAGEVRRVGGGLLFQGPNLTWLPAGAEVDGELHCPTAAQPTDAQWEDLVFAWTVCRAVASNAIVLARKCTTIGVGGGQTNRVGAVELAIKYARQLGHETAGAVLASDGFFPFADNIEVAAGAGVSAIIQPGGSRRDDEVIQAADSAGISMVLTGMRQFRH
jgi:phosphoribosylaminoimidazolecarboxamide formyltransferase/IMP cyclohydrolase